ncbi:MAG: response regulator transcription factor [Verrucomicrobia bacterium]|nr:response regulator transcription factor [Verrucomicrobiota bacterium]
MRILIVDDHPIVRDAVRHLVLTEFPDADVGLASNAGETWTHLHDSTCDLILLDIGLPGTNGLELLKSLKTESPATPILILTGYAEEQYAVRAIRAGASGYLTKEAAREELTTAIRMLATGETYVSEGVKRELFRAVQSHASERPHQTLSDREFAVFCRLAAGRTVCEVATELSLSPKTVSTYRSRLFLKLDIHTNQDLVRYAIEHKLETGSPGL